MSWKTSKEKELLKKDIEDGVVSTQDQARSVYDMHNGVYHRFPYENFRNNLRNLLKTSEKSQTAANRDAAALVVAQAVIEARDNARDEDEYPSWYFSDGRRLLLQDLQSGILEGKRPIAIHQSRPEYLVFPLKIFRDNYYKEKQRPVTKAYWDFLKSQRQQKKKEKQEKKLKKMNQNK
jgi:hypothetical protein